MTFATFTFSSFLLAAVVTKITGTDAAFPGTDTFQTYKDKPTLKAASFDPMTDAQTLRKAMKGWGTDDAAIIEVLAKRTNHQRQQISQAFHKEYDRNLVNDLKEELSGKVEKVVLGLMTPPAEYIARELNNAISSIFTRGSGLVDILCPASNGEIKEFSRTYNKKFGDTLKSDITDSTKGNFQRLLLTLASATRNMDPIGNDALATKDAEDIFESVERSKGTDELAFITRLTERSFAHIRKMWPEFERIAGHPLEKAIEDIFSGDLKKGLLAIVKSASSRAAYFAQRLHDSMAGLGTNDNDLIFIIVSRAEIDLQNIKGQYRKMFGRTLKQDVEGDTSGSYEKALLTLIGN